MKLLAELDEQRVWRNVVTGFGALVLLLSGMPIAVAGSDPGAVSEPLHALVVKIVDQDHFLEWLLQDAVKRGEIAPLGITTTHVRDLRTHLRAQPYDLVIAHIHARPAQKLAAEGILARPVKVFANAHAIIGPDADPAAVAGARDFAAAIARIAEHKACWIVNHHGGLEALQDSFLGGAGRPRCFIDDSDNVGPLAIAVASARAGYTVWGYHPFMRLNAAGMRGFAFGDQFLLQPLNAWVVTGSGRETEASALVDRLLSAEVQQRISSFRLDGGPDTQVWWPAAGAPDQ